jgi:Asp-tRNA(Asn)/Glu-tRNA(Gln) amidotransferase A subunit family amidase
MASGGRTGGLAELLRGSAVAIGDAIRQGDVTAVEVLEAHLERIERVNPRLNAIVTLVAERAQAAAVSADRLLAEDGPRSPIHGVPFTVKDIIATEGIRTTGGTLLLADHVPKASATAVDRLERAGAVLLGKSNCPEFALDMHTWNRVFGGTRNPRDERYTSGGSSGGDSAAVASGCSAFGIGTDYGGSIRWPAHCTGLVSLRPTVGLVPATGQIPYSSPGVLPPPNSLSMQSRLQMIAPIGRHVRDVWEIVKAMAGPDGRDEFCVPVALGDPAAVSVPELRCSWFEGDGCYPVRQDLVAVVAEAAESLASLGLDVRQERPAPIERAEAVFAPLRAADGVPDHAAMAQGRESELTRNMGWWLAGAKSATVAEYRQLGARRDALRAEMLEYLERRPILLLPVASVPAFMPTGDDFSIEPDHSFHVEGVEVPKFGALTCTRSISLFGVPAAVVPCGTSSDGLPVGVQIVGRPFADHEVIAVAAMLEQSFGPWEPSAVVTENAEVLHMASPGT